MTKRTEENEKQYHLRMLIESFEPEELGYKNGVAGLFIFIHENGTKAAIDILGERIADTEINLKGADK